MKYSKTLVWKSIYTVLPDYRNLKELDSILGCAVKAAAIEFFMEFNSPVYVCPSTDFIYARTVIYTTLAEWREFGEIDFGTIDDFWGNENV